MAQFRASASGHGSGAGSIDQLGSDAKAMWQVFLTSVAEYDGWWGNRHDEFSENAFQTWLANMGAVQTAGEAIFGAIQGAAQSTHDNAAMLTEAQAQSAAVVQSANTHH
ncbi:hypothetical protein ACFWP5_16580 [Streptomyces sp. NPDC058469]|uniref:hypothetical protein n=1 Tax=Streptomyces sp. NPDC058469 TaxID=3346514 RepID=UPI003662C7D3